MSAENQNMACMLLQDEDNEVVVGNQLRRMWYSFCKRKVAVLGVGDRADLYHRCDLRAAFGPLRSGKAGSGQHAADARAQTSPGNRRDGTGYFEQDHLRGADFHEGGLLRGGRGLCDRDSPGDFRRIFRREGGSSHHARHGRAAGISGHPAVHRVRQRAGAQSGQRHFVRGHLHGA